MTRAVSSKSDAAESSLSKVRCGAHHSLGSVSSDLSSSSNEISIILGVEQVLKGRNDSQFAQDARLVATAEGGDNNLSGRDLPAREVTGVEVGLVLSGNEYVLASNGDVYAPNEDVQVSDDGVIGHF
ncbi:hypothetical protein V6N11_051737 [Hibiscus sabdariffa]|uniref:Uncharacterized protein n=1 Tax=Hibiscus sabdariffa TaxID=183260 RepID=A0ABR2U8R9_9ROSI